MSVIAEIVNIDLDKGGVNRPANYSKVKDRTEDLRKDRYYVEAHSHPELRTT